LELRDEALEIRGHRLASLVLHAAVDDEAGLDRAAADIDGQEAVSGQA
jgi:hypothetical protein